MTKDKKNVKENLEKSKNKKDVENKKTEPIQEEHVVYVDTKETIEDIDNDLNNRINKLYGLSSTPDKSVKHYDPKELEEVRKKLILLLIGIIIFGVVVIVVMINPFDFSSLKNRNENKVEQGNTGNIQEEEKIPVGELELSHILVLDLNSKITFTTNDFMQIDLFELYRYDSLEINNLSNDIKLYLLKRDDAFYDLINTEEIDEYLKTCDGNGLEISKEKMDLTVKKVFGPKGAVNYDPINYLYYSEDENDKKATLTYENEKFILRCNEFATGTVMTKLVQQNLNKAIKTETGVELYQNVVFLNQTGVYRDPDFTMLITNDKTALLNDYIEKGITYKYIFEEDGDNYYLAKIEKVIETAS